MPRCPNCARETMRTEDWACMYCGYPLISRAFKKIEKTYRQIKEERLMGVSQDAEEEAPEAPVKKQEKKPVKPEKSR